MINNKLIPLLFFSEGEIDDITNITNLILKRYAIKWAQDNGHILEDSSVNDVADIITDVYKNLQYYVGLELYSDALGRKPQ